MQSNSLKPDQVIARGDGRRDGGGPRAVLVDHFPRSPVSATNRPGDKPRFIYLELRIHLSFSTLTHGCAEAITYPFKSVGVHPGAGRAGTLSEVGQLSDIELAKVRIGPRRQYVPLGHKGAAKLGSSKR